MSSAQDIQQAVEQVKAAGRSKPKVGHDPVNQPVINNWVEAIGDRIGMPVRAMHIDFPASDVGPAWTLYAWEPDA